MKNASETEMHELRWVSDPHTVNSTDNELPSGRDNSVSTLRQATDTAHSSPPETSTDGDGNSEPAVSSLANWIDRNALEDLATRLQRHLIALKESKS